MRYTVKITFHTAMFENSNDICEQVKSLQEVNSYKDLVDSTVRTAVVIDNINGKTIQTWK